MDIIPEGGGARSRTLFFLLSVFLKVVEAHEIRVIVMQKTYDKDVEKSLASLKEQVDNGIAIQNAHDKDVKTYNVVKLYQILAIVQDILFWKGHLLIQCKAHLTLEELAELYELRDQDEDLLVERLSQLFSDGK